MQTPQSCMGSVGGIKKNRKVSGVWFGFKVFPVVIADFLEEKKSEKISSVGQNVFRSSAVNTQMSCCSS